jgi:hypothetical protein
MRLPRVRLTVLRLMIAVAVTALVLSVEMGLWDRAVSMVCEGPDREYLFNEAVEVCLFFNLVMIGPAFALYIISRRGRKSDRGGDQAARPAPAPAPRRDATPIPRPSSIE